jgi:D-cysteine desulfhydrase
VSTPEQRETIVAVARASGLLLDPVYTGKAMHGLRQAVERGDIARGARVLFLHTGGLPGLLAQGDAFGAELG